MRYTPEHIAFASEHSAHGAAMHFEPIGPAEIRREFMACSSCGAKLFVRDVTDEQLRREWEGWTR